MTLVLSGADVRRLVPIAACIDSVEHAFLEHARGRSIPPAIVAAHVAHGGFHVKAAGLLGVGNGRAVFAASWPTCSSSASAWAICTTRSRRV